MDVLGETVDIIIGVGGLRRRRRWLIVGYFAAFAVMVICAALQTTETFFQLGPFWRGCASGGALGILIAVFQWLALRRQASFAQLLLWRLQISSRFLEEYRRTSRRRAFRKATASLQAVLFPGMLEFLVARGEFRDAQTFLRLARDLTGSSGDFLFWQTCPACGGRVAGSIAVLLDSAGKLAATSENVNRLGEAIAALRMVLVRGFISRRHARLVPYLAEHQDLIMKQTEKAEESFLDAVSGIVEATGESRRTGHSLISLAPRLAKSSAGIVLIASSCIVGLHFLLRSTGCPDATALTAIVAAIAAPVVSEWHKRTNREADSDLIVPVQELSNPAPGAAADEERHSVSAS